MEERSRDPRTELTECEVRAVPDSYSLAPQVYDDLRRLAHALLTREFRAHSLQSADLVHEAFIRLAPASRTAWNGRAHFLAVASRAMRRILVDHARRATALKRPQEDDRVSSVGLAITEPAYETSLLDIDTALQRLARIDPRRAEVVALRVFGGLTVSEVAEALALSASTVEADWRAARAWLARELQHG